MRVEEPRDAHVESVYAVIGHRESFGKPFGLVVDAANPDRIHVTPVRLGLRMHLRVAVDLGRRGEEELGAVRRGQPERLVRTERTDLEDLDRKALEVGGRRR